MIATDELRSMAASVGLEVPQAATLMMGAADAIDRLDAENAKLRERENNLFSAVIAKSNELLDLLCENEKLRNQLRELGVEVDG